MTTLGLKTYQIQFRDYRDWVIWSTTVKSGSYESALRMAWIELTKAQCASCREIRQATILEQ